MWSIISGIISGVLAPFFTFLNKTEDVKLAEFKVDGQVDMALVTASVAITQANASLLNNRWALLLQALFAVPLGIYYGKCILWDKVLGLGTTDPLKGDISTYSLWIVSFLFMHSAISTWTRKT